MKVLGKEMWVSETDYVNGENYLDGSKLSKKIK